MSFKIGDKVFCTPGLSVSGCTGVVIKVRASDDIIAVDFGARGAYFTFTKNTKYLSLVTPPTEKDVLCEGLPLL